MNIILAGIALFFIFFIGFLPFRVLYLFSDAVGFLLHRVFGYRKKVILDNLNRCFPEMEQKELDRLTVGIYKNLTDVMVEGFKAFTMTRKQLNERFKIINPEILEPYKNSGKSFITTPLLDYMFQPLV